MDVLHITHQFAPETRGGVESYVTDVATEQLRRGQDVHVLTGSHAGRERPVIEELQVGDLPVHRLHRDDRYFDYHAKLWHPGVEALVGDFLARTKPRVVHVHQWIRLTGNLVEIARAQGIPAVITLHDFFTSCPRAFRMRPGAGACHRPLSVESCIDCVPRYGHEGRAELAEGIELFRDQCRAELEMADAVLVGMSSTADLIAATTGIPRERFRVLPLGYRRRFDGAGPLPAPRADEPFRFAYWGGVAAHKGVHVLVDAFRELMASGPPWPVELHVLGAFATAELESELRARADGLPLRFHGPFTVDELLALAPHAGVFPSTCLETHGLVLDECFELGLPCIVCEHGVLAERAAGAGLLVRPGDAGDLAAAMARLSGDPRTWSSLRASLPPPPPDVPAHCDELEAIYRAAAAGDRPEATPVSAHRRIAFLLHQRESALATIDPGGRLP